MEIRRLENACERFLTIGPMRLAMVMLLGIFLFPVPPVQGHAADIVPGTFYSTDNLFRWGIANGMDVSAEIDVIDRCGGGVENCGNQGGACGPRLWTVNLGGGQICANSNRGAIANSRQAHMNGLIEGSTLCCIFFTQNATDETLYGENRSAMNVTFTMDVPVTNIKMVVYNGISIGSINSGTTLTFWLMGRDVSNTLTFAKAVGTQACNTYSGTGASSISASIPRTLARKLEVWVDLTNCALTGGVGWNWQFNQFAVWSQGNKADALTYSNNYLEFADWVRGRSGIIIGAGGGGSETNFTNIIPTTGEPVNTVVINPGRNIILTTGSCQTSGICGSDAYSVRPPGIVPGEGFSGASNCGTNTIQWLGSTINADSHMAVWQFDVDACESPFSIGFGGFLMREGANQPFASSNATNKIHYGNTYPGGGNFTGDGFPSVAFCKQCMGSTGILTYRQFAAVYPTNRGPLATFPHDLAFDQDSNFDLNGVQTVNTAFDTNGVRDFVVTIPRTHTVYGNAFYFAFGAYNTTATPDICPVQATINGFTVNIAASRSTRGAIASGFLRTCYYLLTDFVRTNSLGTDSNGNHNGMNIFNVDQTFNVRLSFPAAAKAPNGPASTGYIIQALQTFDNRKAERIACTSDNLLCYGNINTAGLQLPTTSNIPLQFRSKDACTPSAFGGCAIGALPNVTIYVVPANVASNTTNVRGTVSRDSGATNIESTCSPDCPNLFVAPSGALYFTNITTTSTSFTVGAVKPGYATMNVTLVNAFRGGYIFDVNMLTPDKIGSLASSVGGCNTWNITQDIVKCTISWNTAGCGSFDLKANTCTSGTSGLPPGVTKRYIFDCPKDRSTNQYIVKSRVTDFASGFSASWNNPPDGRTNTATTCNEINTTAIPTQSINAQWNHVLPVLTDESYRAISFNATWLDKPLTQFIVLMQKGTGLATNIRVTIANDSSAQYGSDQPITIITLEDIGTATPGLGAGSVSISQGLVTLSCNFAMCDDSGKTLFGILVVSAVLIFFVFIRAPRFATALMPVFAFYGMGFMGFFPGWLLFIVTLAIVGLAVMFSRSIVSNTGE